MFDLQSILRRAESYGWKFASPTLAGPDFFAEEEIPLEEKFRVENPGPQPTDPNQLARWQAKKDEWDKFQGVKQQVEQRVNQQPTPETTVAMERYIATNVDVKNPFNPPKTPFPQEWRAKNNYPTFSQLLIRAVGDENADKWISSNVVTQETETPTEQPAGGSEEQDAWDSFITGNEPWRNEIRNRFLAKYKDEAKVETAITNAESKMFWGSKEAVGGKGSDTIQDERIAFFLKHPNLLADDPKIGVRLTTDGVNIADFLHGGGDQYMHESAPGAGDGLLSKIKELAQSGNKEFLKHLYNQIKFAIQSQQTAEGKMREKEGEFMKSRDTGEMVDPTPEATGRKKEDVSGTQVMKEKLIGETEEEKEEKAGLVRTITYDGLVKTAEVAQVLVSELRELSEQSIRELINSGAQGGQKESEVMLIVLPEAIEIYLDAALEEINSLVQPQNQAEVAEAERRGVRGATLYVNKDKENKSRVTLQGGSEDFSKLVKGGENSQLQKKLDILLARKKEILRLRNSPPEQISESFGKDDKGNNIVGREFVERTLAEIAFLEKFPPIDEENSSTVKENPFRQPVTVYKSVPEIWKESTRAPNIQNNMQHRWTALLKIFDKEDPQNPGKKIYERFATQKFALKRLVSLLPPHKYIVAGQGWAMGQKVNYTDILYSMLYGGFDQAHLDPENKIAPMVLDTSNPVRPGEVDEDGKPIKVKAQPFFMSPKHSDIIIHPKSEGGHAYHVPEFKKLPKEQKNIALALNNKRLYDQMMIGKPSRKQTTVSNPFVAPNPSTAGPSAPMMPFAAQERKDNIINSLENLKEKMLRLGSKDTSSVDNILGTIKGTDNA